MARAQGTGYPVFDANMFLLWGLAEKAYAFMQGSDKGSAQATGRAAQLQAEVTVETTRMLARNNSEVIHDSANYQVAALHSGPAYDGRIGFTKETVEVARTYCYEGLANRTSGPERVYMYPDGSSGTGSVIVADLTAAVAEEYRRPAGTSEHASALLALPESIRDGRHYADGSAIPMEDLVHLTQASWLIHPQAPAGESQVGAVEDKVRYGLARQVLATWYAQLAPLAADKAEGRDIANRYPMEILPVAIGPADASGNATAAVPGYAVLRAAAMAPWVGASPEAPQDINETYSGYLFGLNATDLQRESSACRLSTTGCCTNWSSGSAPPRCWPPSRTFVPRRRIDATQILRSCSRSAGVRAGVRAIGARPSGCLAHF